MGDFHAISKSFPLEDENERLAIGPVMHSWEGIVLVEPEFLNFNRATGSFHARGLLLADALRACMNELQSRPRS